MLIKIISKFLFSSLIFLSVTLSYADTFSVGAESLRASSDKFSSSKDFKKMAEKVIFEPIKNNQIWELKILDFQPLSDSFDYHQTKTFKRAEYKDWLPFMLTFKASSTKEYYTSVMQFAKQNFQMSSDKDNYDLINFVKIAAQPMDGRKNSVKVFPMIRKSYKMSNKQKDIFSSLYSEYWNNLGKDLGLVVSLYNHEGKFKKSAYFNYMTNSKSQTDFARSPKYKTGFPMYDPIFIDFHGELKMPHFGKLQPIYQDHNYNFSTNNFTFGIILLLRQDDVAQLKDIKIKFKKVSFY